MTDDHTFVGPHGNKVIGREPMLAGWRGYFESFPDYQIEVMDIFERESKFGMFGLAARSKETRGGNGGYPQRGKLACARGEFRCGKLLPT